MTLSLVLASASPRRRDLLARLGLDVDVVPAAIDETPLAAEDPCAHALRVARAKAVAVRGAAGDRPVLAADTVVTVDAVILGKPTGPDDARQMLRRLAGRGHVVVTAMVVAHGSLLVDDLALARVEFVPYSAALYEWYLATGEWADKAGAYAVQGQGAVLVERVEGNVQAVVGLPLARLPMLFDRAGLRMLPAGAVMTLEPRSPAGTAPTSPVAAARAPGH